jgi:hypothetical protein
MSLALKSDQGVRYLRGLFFEMADGRENVPYTLKDQDHSYNGKDYISLYRLYMEANDPTEYTFAINHLDGWEHWEMLKKCTWFTPYADRWARELEIRTRSQALHRLRAEAQSNSKNAFAANKLLLEKGWVEKTPGVKSTVGRPTKAAIKAEADRIFIAHQTAQSDLERISN